MRVAISHDVPGHAIRIVPIGKRIRPGAFVKYVRRLISDDLINGESGKTVNKGVCVKTGVTRARFIFLPEMKIDGVDEASNRVDDVGRVVDDEDVDVTGCGVTVVTGDDIIDDEADDDVGRVVDDEDVDVTGCGVTVVTGDDTIDDEAVVSGDAANDIAVDAMVHLICVKRL